MDHSIQKRPPRDAMLLGLAEILQQPTVAPDTVLLETELWDSMAVVSTVALIDDVTGEIVDGDKLNDCKTVGDVLTLAGVQP